MRHNKIRWIAFVLAFSMMLSNMSTMAAASQAINITTVSTNSNSDLSATGQRTQTNEDRQGIVIGNATTSISAQTEVVTNSIFEDNGSLVIPWVLNEAYDKLKKDPESEEVALTADEQMREAEKRLLAAPKATFTEEVKKEYESKHDNISLYADISTWNSSWNESVNALYQAEKQVSAARVLTITSLYTRDDKNIEEADRVIAWSPPGIIMELEDTLSEDDLKDMKLIHIQQNKGSDGTITYTAKEISFTLIKSSAVDPKTGTSQTYEYPHISFSTDGFGVFAFVRMIDIAPKTDPAIEKTESSSDNQAASVEDSSLVENNSEQSASVSADGADNSTEIQTPADGNNDSDASSVDYVSAKVEDDTIHGADVQGQATETPAATRSLLMNDLYMPSTQARDITNNLFAAPLLTSGNESSSEETVPRQGDGSFIEGISVKWITNDTLENGDDELLYIKPKSNETQSIRMQVNYSLSGERNYSAGDITITVPAYIIHNRAGQNYGSMVIPYPENPSRRADFNWTLVGDNYVLTNTKTMSAATKGYIQFAVTQMEPRQLVDMEESDPFSAYIELSTFMGNTLALKSNEITVQFDTEAKIIDATKSVMGRAERVNASEVPEEKRVAGETQYIRVNWYTNGYVTANTSYTMTIEDTLADEYNGFLKTSDAGNDQVYTTTITNSTSAGGTAYQSITSYYPASQFESDTDYVFHNTVKYTLTETDPEATLDHPELEHDTQLVTVQTASAQVTYHYSLPKWLDPAGHFIVTKNGNDNKANNNYTRHPTFISERSDLHIWQNYEDLHGWYGIYPSAINDLQDGNDVYLSYTIGSIGYVMPWTYDEVVPGTVDPDDPTKWLIPPTRIQENYNQRPVTITTTDTGVRLGRYTPNLTLFDDYEYVSVEFPADPCVLKGTPQNINPDGSWASLTAGDGTFSYDWDLDKSNWPDIKLQIYRDNAWEDWATASWSSGNFVATLHDNTTQTDRVIDVPADTENIRTVVTLTNAGIDFDVRPVIKLKSTATMRSLVASAFEKSNVPEMFVWNGVDMTVERADVDENDEDRYIEALSDEGYDVIRGYTTDTSVVPTIMGTQAVQGVDYEKRLITIHYSANVKERSFIYDLKTYNQAVQDGRIVPETGGTWYDLLPMGVSPVMDSIKLRKDDKIISKKTIPNYKGSGRTLLIVEAELTNAPERYSLGDSHYYQDVPSISFDATYSLDSVVDYGDYIHNVIAFESNNESLGTIENYSGEPDDPTSDNNISTASAFANENEKIWMTNLDPDPNTSDYNNFVYAGAYTRLDYLSAARIELTKEVMTNNDGWWSTGVYWGDKANEERTVFEGGVYSYRLRTVSNAETITKDLIIFDSLENFVAENGNDPIDVAPDGSDLARWQGTLRSVDVSQLSHMGIAPVVYYSTVPNLQLSDESDDQLANAVNTDLSNSNIWIRADNYQGNMADVKAVAIDASKAVDGSDYELQPLETVVVLFEMRAPSGSVASEAIAANAHAYNNVYLTATTIDVDTLDADSSYFTRKDYTKVGLQEYTYTVTKVWDDDNDRDGMRPLNGEVTFELYRNGQPTGTYAVVNDSNPIGKFEHIPFADENGDPYSYSVEELPVSGYTATETHSGTSYVFTNKHEPERISVTGEKTWVGDEGHEDARPASIQVRLYANGEYVGQKTVSRPWTYAFNNLYRYENGVEINYTIEEVVTGKGLSYISAVNGHNIINTYHPYGNLVVAKTVTDATSVSIQQAFNLTFSFVQGSGENIVPLFDDFDYTIYDASDNVVQQGTVTTNGTLPIHHGEYIVIEEIPENTVYSIIEADYPGFKLSNSTNIGGKIKPNDTIRASLTNKYSAAGMLNLAATKQLNNRKIQKYQFQFEVYDEEHNLIRTAKNGSTSSTVSRSDETVEYSIAPVTFGAIRYTQKDAGHTYTYTVVESNHNKAGYTYDATQYTVGVTITDNGDGTLSVVPVYKNSSSEIVDAITFENDYDAVGTLTLRAWKDLQGRTLEEGEFTFKLVDEDNNVVGTATNAADGTVTFNPLTFDETSIGKTYKYAITEVAGADPTVNYDNSSYGYTVTVLDNGDGTLSFTQGLATPIMEDPEPEPFVKYAVSLYGIEVDQVAAEEVVNTEDTASGVTSVATETAGLTFGPALGANYVQSYHSHTPTGTTTSGNQHRCIHDDDWETIIAWNNYDPYVYEQCIAEGCTHSVELTKGTTTTIFNDSFSSARETGDGPSTLFYELIPAGEAENLRWNPKTEGGSSMDGTNKNGWGATRIRAMLNGRDALDSLGSGYALRGIRDSHKSYSVYTTSNNLFAMFPYELQLAIGARVTKYDSDYYDYSVSNLRISYDRLWLLSPAEIWLDAQQNQAGNYSHPLEGAQYPYFIAKSLAPSPTSNSSETLAYNVNSSSGESDGGLFRLALRSATGFTNSSMCWIDTSGAIENGSAVEAHGVSPCFSLTRQNTTTHPDTLPPSEPAKIIVGWETEDAELPVFVNTLKDGNLAVAKIARDAESADPDQEFHFKVQFDGEDLADRTFEYDQGLNRKHIIHLVYNANGGYFNNDPDQTELVLEYKLQNDGTYAITNESKALLVDNGDGTYSLPPVGQDGNIFKAWFEDENFIFPWDPDTDIPLNDTEVFAQWEETGFKYAVSLYGIGTDLVAASNVINTEDTASGITEVSTKVAGLTFGPALGENYIQSYHSHTPTGTTTSGNDHRCLHDDDWETIISWNNVDPYVYEQCIAEGCTHSVELKKNTTTTLFNEEFDTSYETGDGPSGLLYELVLGSESTRNWENLRWNPKTEGGSTSFGTTKNGWGASRIRAMLNGRDALDTLTGYATSASGDVNQDYAVYTSSNNLLAMFPDELQDAIGARATKYDSVYNSKTAANLRTTYDKLWLLSPDEIWTTAQNNNTNFAHPLEGSQYPYFAAKSLTTSTINQTGTVAYRANNYSGNNSGASYDWWLRSSLGTDSYSAIDVYRYGKVINNHAYNTSGVSPCFSLKRSN